MCLLIESDKMDDKKSTAGAHVKIKSSTSTTVQLSDIKHITYTEVVDIRLPFMIVNRVFDLL